MQSPLITCPDYKPKEAIYGFIGKRLKLAKHEYRGTEQHVQENRNRVLELLNIKNSRLSLLKQIHSNKCLLIDAHSQLYSKDLEILLGEQGSTRRRSGSYGGRVIQARRSFSEGWGTGAYPIIREERRFPQFDNAESLKPKSIQEDPEADGQVTNEKGIILGIQTADCVPILFVDKKAKVIGAAHAGWKGALSGIIANTVNAMKSLGSKTENIDAIIGPCIHQRSYEVSHDFVENFLQESKDNTRFFKHSIREGKSMFDLPGYVYMKLRLCGLNKIFNANIDTLNEEENFFSYRRSTLRGIKLDGHILSVIGLK